MHYRLALCLTASFTAGHALDLGSQREAFDSATTWNFTGKPLSEVLDQVDKTAQSQIKRSAKIKAGERSNPVTLIAERTSAAEVLAALERSFDIRFVMDGDSIVAETVEEFRARPRRLVAFDVTAQISPIQNFPGRDLGFTTYDAAGSYDLFASQPTEGARTTTEDLVSFLSRHPNGRLDCRSGGTIYAQVSPAEEADLRAAMAGLGQHGLRAMSWRISFGLLPSSAAIPNGIIDRKEAEILRQSLQQRVAISLAGMNGQRVHAGSYHESAQVSDAEIVSGELDPRIQTIITGKSADFRAIAGFGTTRVDFKIGWADEMPGQKKTPVRSPSRSAKPSEDAPAQKPAKDDGKTIATSSTGRTNVEPGQIVSVDLPELWIWSSRSEVSLPDGKSLVLVGVHDDERAIAIVERVDSDPESRLATAQIDQRPVMDLLTDAAKQLGIGLVVEPVALKQAQEVKSLVLRNANFLEMKRILAKEGLALQIDSGWLRVARPEAAKGGVTLRFYDMRVATAGNLSYPGPDLDIPEPGSVSSRLLPAIQPATAPDVNEFIDIIKREIAPQEWESDGVSIEEYQGMIAVSQTAAIHELIERKLAELAQIQSRQLVCRVYELPAGEESAPTIGSADWKGMAGTRQAPIASFVVQNGSQNNYFCGTQRAYVADGDIVQGQVDPIVTVLSQGLVVDVTPIITDGGVQATVRLTHGAEGKSRHSEIKDDQGGVVLDVETPQVDLASARETRFIPSGGAAIFRLTDHAYAVTFAGDER